MIRAQDVSWELESIVLDGRPVDGVAKAGAGVTLGADGRASGRGGCNRFFGSYQMDKGSIAFGHLASTLMYCEETMAVESAYFQAMGKVRTWIMLDERMEMRSEDGNTVLVFRRACADDAVTDATDH